MRYGCQGRRPNNLPKLADSGDSASLFGFGSAPFRTTSSKGPFWVILGGYSGGWCSGGRLCGWTVSGLAVVLAGGVRVAGVRVGSVERVLSSQRKLVAKQDAEQLVALVFLLAGSLASLHTQQLRELVHKCLSHVCVVQLVVHYDKDALAVRD